MPQYGIQGPINLRIEEAFVDLLDSEGPLTGLTIVAASDRDATVPPLHCFVYCDRADPQVPTGSVFKANVVITLVTNLDDHDTATRRDWWGKILQALTREDFEAEPQEFTSGDITIKGWSIQQVGEVSDGQQTGDVARLSVGAIL